MHHYLLDIQFLARGKSRLRAIYLALLPHLLLVGDKTHFAYQISAILFAQVHGRNAANL